MILSAGAVIARRGMFPPRLASLGGEDSGEGRQATIGALKGHSQPQQTAIAPVHDVSVVFQ